MSTEPRALTANPGEESLTGRLATACTHLKYQSLPLRTKEQAKVILLDTLGAMLSASRPLFPGTQKLARFVQSERADGPCIVVGTSLHASPASAALMNGYLGYALDSESHHGPAIVHASAVVVPAAMASAQQVSHGDGATFLAAIVLGVDVTCRVSLAIGPNALYARGFHPTAIAGSFGAAAAAGSILGLDPSRMERAFGLAASSSSGLLAWASDEQEEARPFNPGLAARNGFVAARLAGSDFGGPLSIFDAEAKYNVFRAWSADGTGSPQLLTDGFGERFAIEDLIVKQYASCSFLHPALDGLLSVIREEGLSAAEIERITLRFPRSGAPIIDGNRLRSHCAQYILPLAAVRRRVQFEDVLFDRSSEEDISRLAHNTTVIHDPVLDEVYPERYATVLSVRTRNGAQYERRVDWAKGCPENPMARDEVIAKYRHLAEQRVDSARADLIRSLVDDLEQPGNLTMLLTALSTG